MSHQSFSCFGSRCGLWVTGAGAEAAIADARRILESWHVRFSRFVGSSELSRVNADPRAVVPVSTTMAQLRVVHDAAEATGGLVDGTLARELEDAGYRSDLAAPLPLALALRLAPPPRRPARPRPWRDFTVDGWEVTRPPALAFDSGGLAKGLFADLIAERLAGLESFAVDCGGDVRFAGRERTVAVADPFGGVVVLDDRSHFTIGVQDLVPQDGPLLPTANP
jgi:thiamine biosynthesis lipoprotein